MSLNCNEYNIDIFADNNFLQLIMPQFVATRIFNLIILVLNEISISYERVHFSD